MIIYDIIKVLVAILVTCTFSLFIFMTNITTFDINSLIINKEKQMVSLTAMAKVFNKNVHGWLRNQSTQDFLEEMQKHSETQICVSVKGGDLQGVEQGTWGTKEVAIKFAQWLNPKFEVFCIKHLNQLFTTGSTSIVPQTYIQALEKLLEAEKEKEKLLLTNDNLSTALDILVEWVSIIKVAQHNKISEKDFNWRILKHQSDSMGFIIKRAESPRFGYQNLYNVHVFKACYPQFDYSFLHKK